MLGSGNGQHRRPRQAPAFVVTAGATGAGIALPLLAATGAHAATASTWDRVAQCESGGQWSENSGNGFYGGLQLTLSDWQQYGGTAYAERPDLASRQEQIAVAERVLEAQGVAAWQDCAVQTGLSGGGPAAVVNTGGPSSALAPSGSGMAGRPESGTSGTSGTSGSSAGPSSAASRAATGSASPSAGVSSASSPAGAGPAASSSAPAAAPGSPTAVPSLPSGASASPTAPAPSGSASAGTAGAVPGAQGAAAAAAPSRGRHAKPVAEVAGSAVPAQGDAVGAAAATGSLDPLLLATAPVAQTGGPYTVQPGDSLSQIASDHTVSGDWTALYDANKSAIGSNPDLIHPGQQLNLG